MIGYVSGSSKLVESVTSLAGQNVLYPDAEIVDMYARSRTSHKQDKREIKDDGIKMGISPHAANDLTISFFDYENPIPSHHLWDMLSEYGTGRFTIDNETLRIPNKTDVYNDDSELLNKVSQGDKDYIHTCDYFYTEFKKKPISEIAYKIRGYQNLGLIKINEYFQRLLSPEIFLEVAKYLQHNRSIEENVAIYGDGEGKKLHPTGRDYLYTQLAPERPTFDVGIPIEPIDIISNGNSGDVGTIYNMKKTLGACLPW